MKYYILLFSLLISYSKAYCQKVDYKSIRRNKLLATCTSDSQVVFKTHDMLMQIDTTKIDKNLDMYYRDLGFIYYDMYVHSRNKKYLDTANTKFSKALLLNPKNIDALWDGAIALVFSNHCDKGMAYLDAYLKLVPSKQIDTASLRSLRNLCATHPKKNTP